MKISAEKKTPAVASADILRFRKCHHCFCTLFDPILTSQLHEGGLPDKKPGNFIQQTGVTYTKSILTLEKMSVNAGNLDIIFDLNFRP